MWRWKLIWQLLRGQRERADWETRAGLSTEQGWLVDVKLAIMKNDLDEMTTKAERAQTLALELRAVVEDCAAQGCPPALRWLRHNRG